MRVEIKKELLYACENFCKRRVQDSKNLYRLRGELRERKIYEDLRTGALAEWAAYFLMKDYLPGLTEPDMTIHEKRRKSYAPDLVSDEYDFHIKGQSFLSSERYGMSSLFQQSDKLLLSPTDRDVLVMCVVEKTYVDIKFLGKIKDVLEAKCVGVPKIQRYGVTKYAIYLDDLLKKEVKQLDLGLSKSPAPLPSNDYPA